VLAGIPNPDILLSPLSSHEAVLSSKIEGTQVTLGEVLEFEAQGHLFDESTPKKADAREVLNYRAALREATNLMTELPLSQRLIKATHRVLMDGVRGRHKDPGEYRRFRTGSARTDVQSSRRALSRQAQSASIRQ
jgi:Fic family protein